MKRIRLSVATGNVLEASAPPAKSGETPISLDKRAICVHAGEFMSKDGAIKFDKARIQHVVDRNNSKLNQLAREYAGSPPPGAYPPVYEDHTDNTRATVGRLLGPFTYEERDIPGVGSQVPCVIAESVRFLGAENCERASDGRMYHVSIGIDESQDDLIVELSVVPEPAAPGAMLLAKGKDQLVKPKYEIEETKEGMFLVKTDKGYVGSESHKTKEDAEQAGEQWAKSQPEIEEGENKKAKAEKVSLSKKKENTMSNKKEAAEGLKRLAGELKTLRTTLVKSGNEVKHLAKKAKVEGELRGLVRLGKMTPAEFRLAKMDDMAKLEDSAFGLVVDAYKNRQPVIEAGQRGSSEAHEAGKMAQEIGMKRLKAETAAELKRMGARVRLSEEDKKLSKKSLESGEGEKEQEDKHLSDAFAGGESKEMSGQYMECMKHCEAAIDAGEKDKAKEHLAKLKHMAEEDPKGMKHMSAGDEMIGAGDAQAKKIAELEEQMGQITSVVERLYAGLDKLMEVEKDEGHEELGAKEGEEKQLGEEDKKDEENKKDEEKHLEGKEAKGDEKDIEQEARKDMGLGEKKDEEKKELSEKDAEDLDKK